ncbi:MAG: zinc-ribbon and DUF3426 domain-containing protein [Rubrivivax sp.]|jgi:predicted Zn finger-like uncharacterized protein
MSLAARCPACGTVFRVVQDQLRISEGWVRCGRCSEVFNAVEHLVDVDADQALTRPSPGHSPRARPAPPPPPPSTEDDDTVWAAHPPGAQPAYAPPAPQAPHTVWPTSDELVESAPPRPPPAYAAPPPQEPARAVAEAVQRSLRDAAQAAQAAQAAATPAPTVAPSPAPALASVAPGAGAPQGRTEPAFDLDQPSRFDAPVDASRATPAGLASDAPAWAAAASSASNDPQPAFLRQAQRAARWRHPGVRAALGLVAVVASAGLLAQVGLTYRDQIAARSPLLQPAVEALCSLQGCKIAPPRQIDALSVDSSGLVRVEGTALYRFNVVLRNRSPLQLALPSLDLTLTDSRGAVIARRVVSPQALGAERPTMPSLGELPLQATLATADNQPISGYTVEIFYP